HFTAAPMLGEGVICDVTERTKLVSKAESRVLVPESWLAVAPQKARVLGHSRPPPGKLPDPDALMVCEFVRWFLTEPFTEEPRYKAAYLWATNAMLCKSGESFTRDGL